MTALAPERLAEVARLVDLDIGLDRKGAADLLAHVDHLTAENARMRDEVDARKTGQRGGEWMDPEGDYWRDPLPQARAAVADLADFIRARDAEVGKEGYRTALADVTSGAFVSGQTYAAVRDSFTGKRIAAEATARALRDAVEWMDENTPDGVMVTRLQVFDFLNDYADRIEREEGASNADT